MKILEDLNNKPNLHQIKNDYWRRKGIEVERVRLPVGDYILCDEKVQDVIDRKTKRNKPLKMMDLLGSFKISVDTKKDIQELVGDICGKQHERFRDELILAQNNGIQLYIVVENIGDYVDKRQTIWNDTVRNLSDLHSWKNPRSFLFRNGKQLYPTATKGITLQKACMTLEAKYGCKFIFCTPQESGYVVINLLTGKAGSVDG